MLSLNLAPILRARGIEKPYTFLVKAGLSPHSATKILNYRTRVFRLDHVELLCKTLFCEPNDLLIWTPDKGQIYAENLPLSKLKKTESVGNWHETLAKMPYKELQEVAKDILNKEKNKT